MGKIIRLTESDLNRIVRRVIKEQGAMPPTPLGAARDNTPVTSASPRVGTAAGGILSIIPNLVQVINGSGTSDQKVKQFCSLCNSSKSQITSNGNRLADMIRDSVQGMGTDEKKIYSVFNSLKSLDDFCSLVKAYKASYDVDLYSDLDSDIDSENEWVLIFRPIRDVILKQQQSSQAPQKIGPQATRQARNNTTVGRPSQQPTSRTVALGGQARDNTAAGRPTQQAPQRTVAGVSYR